MNKIKKIEEILKHNNGIILTSDLKKHNIERQYLKILEQRETIEKVSRGIYVSSGSFEDEFYCLQQRYKKGIFSYNTSLYFHDLTDRTPIKIDMTFPSTYRINKNSIVNAHYVKENLFYIGTIELISPKGHQIKVYNVERTICDLIKNRNKIDSQIVRDAIVRYMKKDNKDLLLLSKYAKSFKVERILKQYMEVMI